MGTTFYAQPVPQRTAHPEAFDFDVLHTGSVTEVLAAVRSLNPDVHGAVVVDSISHLWDACRNAYSGKLTRHGGIPLHAWGAVKRPYKELVNLLLSLPVHVILCGRQGIDYGEDEGSCELKQIGFRLRAEGETAYKPDVLVRMESHKANRRQGATVLAHVEKDRTGILAGATIEWPTFEKLDRRSWACWGTGTRRSSPTRRSGSRTPRHWPTGRTIGSASRPNRPARSRNGLPRRPRWRACVGWRAN
jgi:hypothetical protein